jgi:hypothetical protein
MTVKERIVEILKTNPDLSNAGLSLALGKEPGKLVSSSDASAARKELGIVRVRGGNNKGPRAGQPKVTDRRPIGQSKKQVVTKIFALADEIGGLGQLKRWVEVLEEVENL